MTPDARGLFSHSGAAEARGEDARSAAWLARACPALDRRPSVGLPAGQAGSRILGNEGGRAWQGPGNPGSASGFLLISRTVEKSMGTCSERCRRGTPFARVAAGPPSRPAASPTRLPVSSSGTFASREGRETAAVQGHLLEKLQLTSHCQLSGPLPTAGSPGSVGLGEACRRCGTGRFLPLAPPLRPLLPLPPSHRPSQGIAALSIPVHHAPAIVPLFSEALGYLAITSDARLARRRGRGLCPSPPSTATPSAPPVSKPPQPAAQRDAGLER